MGDRIKVEGFVTKIFENKGENSRGPWTAYSLRIANPDGTLNPRFFQWGFKAPSCRSDEQTQGHGDFISFEAEIKDDRAAKYIEGTGRVLKNAPARQAVEKPKEGNRGNFRGGGGGQRAERKPTESKLFGQIGGYNTEDDIRRMSYTAARGDAVAVVTALLTHDALPMTSAKTKAGEAARFEEIMEAVNKLTVQFYFDAATGRQIERVADPFKGAVAAGKLPEDGDQLDADGGDQPDQDVDSMDAPPADDDSVAM